MGGSKAQTVGYKFSVGFDVALGIGPFDSITQIDIGEKTAWTGVSSGASISINEPELFGGDTKEGGIVGEVDVQLGTPTQTQNLYLTGLLGSDVPYYRGLARIIAKGVYIGLNPYPKPWHVWANRIHLRSDGSTQWYDAKAEVPGSNFGMNPAHIIREILTDTIWGMGYPEAKIDDTNFMAVADTLYSEGVGLSFLLQQSSEVKDFLELVLKHIDGSLYSDRKTGLFKLVLARDDYTPASLPVYDEDSIQKVTEFKRGLIGELINSVSVVYSDPNTDEKASVTVQDIALVTAQGGQINITKQYPGFRSGELASRAASRVLKALSTPLATATFVGNRTLSALDIGSVFKLSWGDYGIVELIMRVVSVEYGAPGNNLIKIKCVEDVFALGEAIYAAPNDSEWTIPINDPVAVPIHAVIESPYYELAQRIGDNDAAAMALDSGTVVATGVRPTIDAINATIYSDYASGGAYTETRIVDFCPSVRASSDISYLTTLIPYDLNVDVDGIAVNTYALLNDEIVKVEAVTSTDITISRGCLDTIPALHVATDRLLFVDEFFETDNREYFDGETVNIKLLTSTGNGQLAEGSAPAQSVLMTSRAQRPYAPGRLELNGNYYTPAPAGDPYPAAVPGDQDLIVTWRHRDRLQQTATIYENAYDFDIGPEAGTTYTVELLTLGGSTISSVTGVTGNTHTFTLAAMGANYGVLRVRLWSVRDGLDSHQKYDYQFVRAGYGAGYGYAYGGAP